MGSNLGSRKAHFIWWYFGWNLKDTQEIYKEIIKVSMVQMKERICESPKTEKEWAGLKKKKASLCRILSNQEKDSGWD